MRAHAASRPPGGWLTGSYGRWVIGLGRGWSSERLDLEPLAVARTAELAPLLDDPALHEFTGGAPLSAAALAVRYARLAARRSPGGDQMRGNWVIARRSWPAPSSRHAASSSGRGSRPADHASYPAQPAPPSPATPPSRPPARREITALPCPTRRPPKPELAAFGTRARQAVTAGSSKTSGLADERASPRPTSASAQVLLRRYHINGRYPGNLKILPHKL
jgi:hypothetical protein